MLFFRKYINLQDLLVLLSGISVMYSSQDKQKRNLKMQSFQHHSDLISLHLPTFSELKWTAVSSIFLFHVDAIVNTPLGHNRFVSFDKNPHCSKWLMYSAWWYLGMIQKVQVRCFEKGLSMSLYGQWDDELGLGLVWV